jgi:hypothetical protein
MGQRQRQVSHRQFVLHVTDGFEVRRALMLGEGIYKYRLVPPRKPLSVQWN